MADAICCEEKTMEEIKAVSKEFGIENFEYINEYIKQQKNDKPDERLSEDFVYRFLVENIVNKANNYYQKYNQAPLYSRIVQNIEDEIIRSCDNIRSMINNINALSEMTYESSLCQGNLTLNLFLSNVDLLIKFENEEYQVDIDFDKEGIKYLRKLLQIAQKDMCLVLSRNGEKWTPIGYAAKNNGSTLPTFTITGPLSWKFSAANEFATFSRGKYIVAKPEVSKQDKTIEFLCKHLIDVDVNILSDLVDKIKKDKDIHGALFVFIDDEQQQAINKLCKYKRGIKISENTMTNLTNETFVNNHLLDLCKIDGAIVFNKKGQLLSIGTILDGCVISSGNVGRGSRYNSTKTFVEYYSQPQSVWADKKVEPKIKTKVDLNCIGLVISEDEYVNLIFKDKIYSDDTWASLI